MKIGEQKTYNLKKSGDKFTGKVNTLVEQAQCVIFAETANDEVQQFWKYDVSTHSVDIFYYLTLKVLVMTTDAQWEGMGDVGSVRYELALLPPCPTISVLSYSN